MINNDDIRAEIAELERRAMSNTVTKGAISVTTNPISSRPR